ncbi:MAG: hypothetical protein JWO03_3353 [Bacteroidetes bacterium]|nr:hypothetical protein [Bacteroidota bacterium]
MKKNDPYQIPKITFTSIAKEKRMTIYLGLYEDEVLWANMKKAADKEDYDQAIVFRDELIRRGKLQTIII